VSEVNGAFTYSSEKSRNEFLKELAELMKKYRVEKLDIAWAKKFEATYEAVRDE